MPKIIKNMLVVIVIISIQAQLFGQNEGFRENQLREKVNTELLKSYSKCQPIKIENGVSEFHEKTEMWSVCNLDKGNRIIRIESYENNTFYQEVYFELNGKLRYAKETENYNLKNRFAAMKWNCEFFFENEKLMTIMSLGHGKTEDENWNPESIVEVYNSRIHELSKMKKQK